LENKNIHFHTDKQQLLEENLAKNPCNKFMSTGACPYGNQCKYRHLTNQDLQKLKGNIFNVSFLSGRRL